jgi:hypothetical protein
MNRYQMKQPPEPTLDQMTLRDLMAMFAVMGHLQEDHSRADFVALAAYIMADAMIRARAVPHD